VYDCPVRRLVIVCMLFAGARAAGADTPGSTVADRQLAEARCAAHDPTCDWFSTLGSLERTTVQRALIKRGYELEPAPWGKVIGKVHVYNEEVFAEGGHLLQFLNNFHVTTKERAIRNEAVVQDGELWDDERIAETARRLRDPLWSSVIAVVPVKSSEPGKVDVLIVTRDVWSLRFNTKYTFQAGKLTNLQMSLSENNFLGRRNVFAAAVTMDQGAIAVGPLFLASNVLDQHYDVSINVRDILSRDALLNDSTFHREGTSSSIAISRPLWSLATKWGYGASFQHRFAINRDFRGTSPRLVKCLPGAPCEDSLDPMPAADEFPWIYGIRGWGVREYVTRQWGTQWKQNLTLGHTVDSVRPRLLEDFAGTAEQADAFKAFVFPRSEVTSVLFATYNVFTPVYRTRRNVQTYDLAEDLRLGPSVETSFGVGLKALGSDANFQRGGVTGGWTFPWCRDGSVTLSSGVNGRYQAKEFIDNTASVSTRIVTPLWPQGRFVIESTLATRWHDTQNSSYGIGGDPGLRGFGINQFRGQRVFSSQAEARSRSYPFWVLRVGGVLFYEAGGAADTLRAITPHQDVGLGVRVLIPQTSRELFRFDIPFPLDGANAGRPRFIASFDQAF
jgi:hypothetical protein